MSIARELGFDEVNPLDIIEHHWTEWTRAEPALAAVPVPADLLDWLSSAQPSAATPTSPTYAEADTVLRSLARLAAVDGGDDSLAAGVLAWTMLPAAAQVARDAHTLDPTRIDQIVASHLWIVVRSFSWRTRKGSVSGNLARDLRANVFHDLGIGGGAPDAHLRSFPVDPTVLDPIDVGAVDPGDDLSGMSLFELLDLGCETGNISWGDRALMLTIVDRARDHPPRMGQGALGGLLGDQVAEAVGAHYQLSGRQVRRRANSCVQALARMVGQG